MPKLESNIKLTNYATIKKDMIIYATNVNALKNEELFSKFYRLVDDERKNKINRYRFLKDKALSLGAWLLLKFAMSEFGHGNTEIKISLNKNGKPYLCGTKNFYFNLSHSEEIATCAVSKKEVGCDVEKVSKADFEIAKNFFHPEEYRLIDKEVSQERKNDIFYRLWTLKESFVKATGLGMSIPFNEFNIIINASSIKIEQKINNETYYFKEYDVGKGYKFACCSLENDFPEEITFVDLSKL